MDKFIRASLIRAARTVAQTAIATIASAQILEDVSWSVVISASILAGILSILTSIATGLPEVDQEKMIYMDMEEPEDAEVEDNEDE